MERDLGKLILAGDRRVSKCQEVIIFALISFMYNNVYVGKHINIVLI